MPSRRAIEPNTNRRTSVRASVDRCSVARGVAVEGGLLLEWFSVWTWRACRGCEGEGAAIRGGGAR